FDLTPHEIQLKSVMVAELGLLRIPRKSVKEDAARKEVAERTHDLEVRIAEFFASGMDDGDIEQRDPRLLSRAVLGLYNSIWHWYPSARLTTLEDVSAFFVPRILALTGIGLDDDEAMSSFAPRVSRA